MIDVTRHASGPPAGIETTHVRVQARPAGFFADVATMAGRSLRNAARDPEAIVPALIVGIFFFVVNVGAFSGVFESNDPNFDVKAFQLPVALIFAITGLSRAGALVIDIQDGYLERLLVTPISRISLLMGLMVADMVLVSFLAVMILVLGLIFGVSFASGPLGAVVFVLAGALWALAYNGFPYAIALRTGNPAAVNSSFLLFFPFAFLTTTFVPQDALTGWFATVAKLNPVTYILEGMRSLLIDGWVWKDLALMLLAIVSIGIVTLSLALWALRRRVTSP